MTKMAIITNITEQSEPLSNRPQYNINILSDYEIKLANLDPLVLGAAIFIILFAIFCFPSTSHICKIPYSDEIFTSYCSSFIPDFTAIVQAQVKAQEELLKHSVLIDSQSSESISHDIKKAEMATKDLVTVVKYSNLHYSKPLVKKLTEFADCSFTVNRNLQTLQVRAQGSLDNTMTYMSYTLDTALSLKDKVISAKEHRELTRLHNTLMITTNDDLRKLIIATEDAWRGLKQLDELQEQIHDITSQENRLQVLGKNELMSHLWSVLGGNVVEKRFFIENLELLKNMDKQRTNAVLQLIKIMDSLTLFQNQLEILREETVNPLIVDIPLELHLINMKKALMRLQAGQITNGKN